LRQPEPRRGTAPALTPSQSNRFVNKPHSLSSGLQELKLLTLFAQHLHVEVTVGFNPVFVDFDGQGSDQPQAARFIRKDSDPHYVVPKR
jgi:hypothetical protein